MFRKRLKPVQSPTSQRIDTTIVVLDYLCRKEFSEAGWPAGEIAGDFFCGNLFDQLYLRTLSVIINKGEPMALRPSWFMGANDVRCWNCSDRTRNFRSVKVTCRVILAAGDICALALGASSWPGKGSTLHHGLDVAVHRLPCTNPDAGAAEIARLTVKTASTEVWPVMYSSAVSMTP